MASLTGQNVNTSYKDLLTVAGTTSGQGIESSLKQLFDGNGDGTALSLSTSDIGVRGNFLTDSVTDFIFKNSSGTTLFQIDSGGVIKLKEQTSIPSGIEGGLYYKDSVLYLGIDE
jgi:primase-polymerase (primpol)-like protein